MRVSSVLKLVSSRVAVISSFLHAMICQQLVLSCRNCVYICTLSAG